ncbi:hypothetical protein [Actinoalloteichus sp. GBA129-24]|uniref:hypothetical protein n=1 Tax=Actinoalloteichus sp. GBA129-24 TaxID=1612551 RepID=UPI0009505923|nr:hypothetical protein [Actinoalloteichus sp. GBA129-24]APU20903.1 hypothetical protein UA75_14465 [Actinoalloteichus sp. GBA129-24]APU24152.1 hypothetical protein UA75_30945 [Actinoalloteichus sp. GBA129-24]
MTDTADDLKKAATAFRRAETVLANARTRLADAIRAADADGVRQAEIARITGYTRENIRLIVRAPAD